VHNSDSKYYKECGSVVKSVMRKVARVRGIVLIDGVHATKVVIKSLLLRVSFVYDQPQMLGYLRVVGF